MNKRNFRQYNENTGLFVRHRVWRGGRKAMVNIVQLHDEFNRNTYGGLRQLDIRVSVLGKQVVAIQQFIKGVAEMTAVPGKKLVLPPGGGKH